jgi:hypothetical protein
MERLLSKLLACLILVAILGGCAATSPMATSFIGLPGFAALDVRSQTEVTLAEPNFVLVKTNLTGASKGFSLLGLLTIVPPKFDTAFGRLYAQAEMQPDRPQTLANVVLERTSSYWILFSIPRCSVRADVVEFVPTPSRKSSANQPQ